MLTLLIVIPLIAMLLVGVLPKEKEHFARIIAVAVAAVQLVISLIVFVQFDHSGVLQFVQQAEWIRLPLGSLGVLSIKYFVGVDGLSISMVLLSAIVMLVGAIASWNVEHRVKGYFALYLLMSATVIGCFVSLDLFLFYIFFELMLLPMYFLIGIWGGPGREYASVKFFLYTLLGSVLILLVVIGLYMSVVDPLQTAAQLGMPIDANTVREVQMELQFGKIPSSALVHTFDMTYMTNPDNYIPGSVFSLFADWDFMGVPIRNVAFLLLFIGFAIKLPSVPLHTWLPDAHVEAPTPVSVVLAGVLLKVGGYGLLRTAYSFFPAEASTYATLVAGLGVVSIIYGAFSAIGQQDLKKMIAYSSVSHMGFVLLGIASMTVEGMNGAIYQMFSHGILSSMLFLVAGVVYDRTGDRMIEHYRGLSSKMPTFTVFVTIAFFASIGMPGFSGFIAEMLVLLGAFHSPSANGLIPYWMAVVAALGLILGAVYFLWTMQRMFWGKFWINHNVVKLKKGLEDLDRREWLMLAPLAIMTLVFGLMPSLLTDRTGQWVNTLVSDFANWMR